ncbi:hypothetical protein CGZ80_05900 [Rhodopirellula sp. MGV]|nr:hypothetical protein CGZ80_05900 [Rhodopirellula sp. MGV]
MLFQRKSSTPQMQLESPTCLKPHRQIRFWIPNAVEIKITGFLNEDLVRIARTNPILVISFCRV